MRSNIFIIIFIYFLSVNIYGQKTKVDSFENIIKTSKSDTIKIHTYQNLFLEYEFNDSEKARDCLNKALELCKKNNNKKELAVTYNYFGFLSEDEGNFSEALEHYFSALKIVRLLDDKTMTATVYNNIGLVYSTQSNYTEALKYHKASLELVESLGDKMSAASSYINIALVYGAIGNHPEALKNHFISLKIKEEINDKSGIATSYNGIGNIYFSNKKYQEALQYYKNSLKTAEAINDQQIIAEAHNNIGIVNIAESNYPIALEHYLLSLKIKESIGDYKGTASAYANIGEIYFFKNDYLHALDNFFTALKIYEKIGKKDGIALVNANISQILLKQKKYADAEKRLIIARSLSEEIGHKENLSYSYLCLANLDSARGNFKAAFGHHKLYILYRDSIDNEESRKKTIQTQMTYEFEKKEAIATAEHKKELENQKALAEEKSRKQRIVIVLVAFGLILVLVFAVFIFRSLRITRRQKQMIETQKDEIEAQRDMVTQQKEYIEEIHQEVTDSIHYAKRIQTAVLPDEEYIKSILISVTNDSGITTNSNCVTKNDNCVTKNDNCVTMNDNCVTMNDNCMTMNDNCMTINFNVANYFIFFKPKDIVSGDFYFVEKRKNFLFLAVADCTGHGVPGAFMSMLGISFLNEIIAKEEIQTAGKVLDEVREYIIKSLQQKGISGEQKDGMDIALCVINTANLEMQFAGANNPCWIVSSRQSAVSSQELTAKSQLLDRVSELACPDKSVIELKPDKQPIGIHSNMHPFTNQNYQLQKGDTIYLMSDGFEDQFGGPNRKKFLAKNLKNLLLAKSDAMSLPNCQLPMADQKHILETTITEWIGTGEQIDDITILGIKI